MSNKYKEQTLRIIDPTWSSVQSQVYTTLPRNLNKNKRNYNDINNTQHNKFLTLPKKKTNKLLSEVCEPPKKDIKTLALREAGDKIESHLLINSIDTLCKVGDKVESPSVINRKEHNKYIATWNGKSLNKDELYQLKTYIDKQNITALCITFIRPIDYKNALKPLFEGVVSKSKTINNLCLNINPIAAPELTSAYFNKLLSCAIKKLHKSEGQYLKSISIGSDTIKPIDKITFEKIFKAIYDVTENTHLKSETHCLKIFVTIGNYFEKVYHKYEKKYSKTILLKTINYSTSDTNAALKNIIEFSEQPYTSILSIFKKFCNKTIRNVNSNKSAYDEEETNVSTSTTDNQDSLQDYVVSGDLQSIVDDVYL